MKNIAVILTLGILLISSAVLVSIPKNAIAQQEEETDDDYTMTKEQILAKITDFKTKHPKLAAVVEGIPIETCKILLKDILVQNLYKNCLNITIKIK